MTNHTAPFLALAALALSGCVVESQPQPPTAAAQPSQAPAAQPAPPQVGFSPDVSNAAVNACRDALDAETDGGVDVTGTGTGTEFSQANSTVYMVVGDNRAPWGCLVSNGGEGAELTFIGTEGTL